MSDLLVKDVRLPDGAAVDILVREGRIARLAEGIEAAEGVPALEGAGRLVLPGAVDMHVHFRQPGGEHKETLLSGARAAAKGGVTTCADMPNTSPATTTVAALEEKVALGRGAPANLLFNFGATPDNLEEVRAAAQHPAVYALKIYMGPSTGQSGMVPEATERHFRQAAELDLPVMVHAEEISLIEAQQGAHEPDARNHHLFRPLEAELQAVERALAWAAEYGVQLYLAHVTSARVLDLVEAHPRREQVFVEVCPHHLALAVESIAEPLPNRYKVNPPLRPEDERAALFEALAERIDGLGSDHAPHTLAEKDTPYEQAPSGIPGVEYLLPLALTWHHAGHYGLERLVALTSGNAARWFGLNKGSLEPRMDADLVLVDMDEAWSIAEGDDRVASACGWTPYAGRAMQGRPQVTIVGGRVVYDLDGPAANPGTSAAS